MWLFNSNQDAQKKTTITEWIFCLAKSIWVCLFLFYDYIIHPVFSLKTNETALQTLLFQWLKLFQMDGNFLLHSSIKSDTWNQLNDFSSIFMSSVILLLYTVSETHFFNHIWSDFLKPKWSELHLKWLFFCASEVNTHLRHLKWKIQKSHLQEEWLFLRMYKLVLCSNFDGK